MLNLLPIPPMEKDKGKNEGKGQSGLTVLPANSGLPRFPLSDPALRLGSLSRWAGFCGRKKPATLACCAQSLPDQSVSSALSVAEPLPVMIVPDHSDLTSPPTPLGELLDLSEPWGNRYHCNALPVSSGVCKDSSFGSS